MRDWYDFLQEGRINNRSGPANEENVALVVKTKKGKGKKPFQRNKGRKVRGKQKANDISQNKCFICHKTSHYARDNPNKKGKYKGNHHASTTDVEDEPQRKKAKGSTSDQENRKEYYLISTLFGTLTSITKT